jgi:hypothetical protein
MEEKQMKLKVIVCSLQAKATEQNKIRYKNARGIIIVQSESAFKPRPLKFKQAMA